VILRVSARKSGNVTTLCVQGSLVNGETEALIDAVRFYANSRVIVLDFVGVEIIDARGLGILLELRAFTQSRGIEFRMINVNRPVQQMLELTHLDSLFEVSLRPDGRPVRRASRARQRLLTRRQRVRRLRANPYR